MGVTASFKEGTYFGNEPEKEKRMLLINPLLLSGWFCILGAHKKVMSGRPLNGLHRHADLGERQWPGIAFFAAFKGDKRP